jgi:hypothetical protein
MTVSDGRVCRPSASTSIADILLPCGGNLRIPFLSTMSLLNATDNEPRSYMEIADALRQYGAKAVICATMASCTSRQRAGASHRPMTSIPFRSISSPGKGHLDAYLKPFIRAAITDDRLQEEIVQAPGLDGNDEENEVLGKTTEPALKARYEQQELKRRD